jgi:tetratricopeptide (TPR) repeat protein
MLAIAGLVAVLVLAFGLRETMSRIGEPQSAGEVVRLLMDQHRPFEGRMSGQPELPFVSTRGPEDSDANFDLLTGQMTRLGATPAEMGRFYLLQRNFGRAIEYLRPAAQEQGATAAVHNDLGVAYLESGGSDDLRAATAQFNEALAAKGDFAPAVFNLALAYERLGDVSGERDALTRFLQVETDKAWADEARAKLEGIKAE